MDGWDVLNTGVAGLIGVAGSIYTLRTTRRDADRTRVNLMIENVLQLIEETHNAAIGEFATVIASQRGTPAEAKALRTQNPDDWSRVITNFNIIKTKLVILGADVARQEISKYKDIAIGAMMEARAGKVVDPEHYLSNLVTELRACLRNVENELAARCV